MNSGLTKRECGGCLYFLLVPGGVWMAQNHRFFFFASGGGPFV